MDEKDIPVGLSVGDIAECLGEDINSEEFVDFIKYLKKSYDYSDMYDDISEYKSMYDSKKQQGCPYSTAAWCNWLAYLPVTEKVAGSSPVVVAIK